MSTAAGWEKYGDWTEAQQKPLLEWLCREAAIRPGMVALDVATGPGFPALEIARRVEPGGGVIGTDIAADMLAGCERRARAAGIRNMSLRETDMHDLAGIADASVGAATSALALMFSPRPDDALRAVHRVLRPGARLALAVWDEPSKNPFFTTLFGALSSVVPMPAPPPGAPGLFAMAEPAILQRLLREAGFVAPKVESVPFVFDFDSLDHHWDLNVAMGAPVKRAVESASPDEVRRMRAAVANALAPYRDGERVRITATALCAAAERG